MTSAALTRDHLPAEVTRTKPIAMSCGLAAVFLLFSFASSIANAQPSLLGPSTSTSSTTEGARISFFDTTSNIHWVFWSNGSAIEYASSPDGFTWTSQGTLAHKTPNYSVAFKEIGGTSYVFLVSEANTYDVIMRRGTISSTCITFESEVTALDGSSANDSYIRPHVAFDLNGKVWTSAFKDLGDIK